MTLDALVKTLLGLSFPDSLNIGDTPMILRQFLHSDPVAASYLFGCGGRATAAVVDPLGNPAPYLSAAEATGMRIRYVIDTHLHADHVSAGRALADAAGADYVLFAEAAANFPFRGVRDGEVLELGNVAIDGAAYAGAHARAYLPPRHRSNARRRALVCAHRSHAHGG